MYNRIPPAFAYPPTPPATAVHEKPLDLGQLIRFLISNWLLMTIFTALFVTAALVYIIITPPTFVASVQLMLESQQVTSNDAPRTIAEEALVEGQLEVVKSSEVLRAVVRDLKLDADPEFNPSNVSTMDSLRSLLGTMLHGRQSQGASQEETRENAIISALRRQLWVRQVGQSTVMEIGAASTDPKKAAAIANAVAEQYIAHDVAMKSQSAQQSSEWLEQRVALLKEQVFAADRAVTQFQLSGDAAGQFKLAELKSVADTYRRLYETYVLSWSEAKQRISYPVSDASFVSRATVPVSKSEPKTALVLAFALVLGVSSGLVTAIIRHLANRVVTSADRISLETELPCIGEVSFAGTVRPRQKGPLSDLPRVEAMSHEANSRNQPFNRDLRNLRATIAGLRRSRKANLIGIIGVDARAGATTVAYNLALLASASGSKTLLVDASATNPTLSKAFAEERSVGLMEVLNDARAYADFVARIDKRLTILPIGQYSDVTPGERIGSERFAFSFADLKERFDLILVDLPSMPESADAKAIAPHLDGSIIITRHGKTSFDTLGDTVEALSEVGAEIFGVVLNATPLRRKRWKGISS